MGGGLMQLVAYGAQDVYLTGNPQITFFKVVYRRHTNFSMESIRQVWMGGSDTAGHMSATISRNGDLVNGLHLEVVHQINSSAVANAVHSMIDTVECEIGGQMIDRQSGEWMEVYSELTEPDPDGRIIKHDAPGASAGHGSKFQLMSGCGGVISDRSKYHRNIVPFRFWFCRNPGLALPLIALQYHEVKINLSFKDAMNADIITNKLYADYIYLDTDERRRFAQVSHEYLIEQVQLNEFNIENKQNQFELKFYHPVKELIFSYDWYNSNGSGNSIISNNKEDFYQYGTIPALGDNNIKFTLEINGNHLLYKDRNINYFTRREMWEKHSGVCNIYGYKELVGSKSFEGRIISNSESSLFNDSIGVYSFALKPEDYQPSGTCNFSTVSKVLFTMDNVDVINYKNYLFKIYARNYNILRIISGSGKLAFIN